MAIACASVDPGDGLRARQSLDQLALARLLAGACAGWIIPLAMAYIGDVDALRAAPAGARPLPAGQILGQLFGQAAGGVLGDLFGWRNVFFVLGGDVRARDRRR